MKVKEVQSVIINDERYVLVPDREYARLRQINADGLPPLPLKDERGRRDLMEYGMYSIARDMVLMRRSAGLSQPQLAKLAGLRTETICRVESGKHMPTVRTLQKIERAIKQTTAKRRRAG